VIGLLGLLLQAFEDFGLYVEAGVVTVINLGIEAFELIVDGILAVLPELPEIVAPPGLVAEANSILPIGAVVAVGGPLLAVFITWLGVSWLLRRAGVIE
jgi:hypothetical protein